MERFFLVVFIFLPSFSPAQYTETFGLTSRGIEGTCTANDPSFCAVNNFAGVNWSITATDYTLLADFSDYFITINGDLQARDVDAEVCWYSPFLDISGAGLDVDIEVDLAWDNMDRSDYVNVEYIIDGGAWIQIPNVSGGGLGTIQNETGSFSGLATARVAGLSGSNMQIRICGEVNQDNENFEIEEVRVADPNVILPVEFYAVEGTYKEDHILVEWATQSEEDNDYFSIERSDDGMEFELIATVFSQGNSQNIQVYQFKDFEFRGAKQYYRLKQVDLGGSFSYGPMVEVKWDKRRNQVGKLYPNPNQNGKFHFKYWFATDALVNVAVFDALGKKVFGKTRTFYHEKNHADLDFGHLGSGVFLVKVHDGQEEYVQKIILH